MHVGCGKGTVGQALAGAEMGEASLGAGLGLSCSLTASFPHFFQTLKVLRQVELINFGDCLVRSRGAVAIAEAVRGGLPKLKVCVGGPSSKGQRWALGRSGVSSGPLGSVGPGLWRGRAFSWEGRAPAAAVFMPSASHCPHSTLGAEFVLL